jgi:CTP synthase
MHFGMHDVKEPDLTKWLEVIERVENPKGEVKIAIVGKYNKIEDAYKSLVEAFEHAGISNSCKVKLKWVNASNLKEEDLETKFADVDGILVPGGFGARGIEGKILAIKYARENKIPFFGICLGMQLAVIEFARHVAGIEDASSTEFTSECSNVIAMMSEWDKDGVKEERSATSNMGGTMRLGSYDCVIKEGSKAHEVYRSTLIQERHRHRYEFNNQFKNQLEDCGIVFSGLSPDGKLAEIIELKNHPWFIGVQFHPELKSRPYPAHPLFTSFIKQAINNK